MRPFNLPIKNHRRRSMPLARAVAPAALASAVLALAMPVHAQEQFVEAPETIAACLCLQQDISRAGGNLGTAKTEYEAKRKEVETLDSEVTTQRPHVDVNDPAAIARFRDLLARRDAAAQLFADRTSPDYRALVEHYDQKVASFNKTCAGKVFDPTVEARVKQSLTCPAP